MAKVYNTKTNSLRWEDDISGVVEDAWFEITEILAVKKLDGHDMYDQWLMAVELRVKDLMDTLNDSPYTYEDMINNKTIY